MSTFIETLSGGVPGGVLLFAFVLISGNLLMRFLKSSKLISPQKCIRLQIRYSIIISILYITLWFALRPPLPPERMVIMPTHPEHDNLLLDGSELEFTEKLQQVLVGQLRPKYLLHRWEWMIETLGTDSMYSYQSWIRLAQKMDAKFIIENRKFGNTIHVTALRPGDSDGDTLKIKLKNMSEIPALLSVLDDQYSIFKSKQPDVVNISPDYVKAKMHLYKNDFDLAISVLNGATDTLSQVLLARAYMQRGLTKKIDRVKAEYVKIENPDFNSAKQIISPILRGSPDTPGIAYIMGRIAIREGEYGKAGIYLKKAFLDDPADCRIHYALSFLLPERLQEIGYINSTEILEKAITIDPGYRDAVHELSEEYYNTGTGTPSGLGTTNALSTMENFLKLNSDDPRILSLLGSVYIRISRLAEAEEIFKKLQKRYPDDSDILYNLGIVSYQKNDLQKALDYFLKAIEMDNNLDAYLYAGVIYREWEEYEKALKYFRERVKRMTGEDDTYAKEAMLGIRKTLKDLGQDSLYAD